MFLNKFLLTLAKLLRTQNKIKRATSFYGLNEKKAEKEINRINKLRANHYKHYTDKEWAAHENYDICINSDTLGVEKAAELICNIVNDDKVIV